MENIVQKQRLFFETHGTLNIEFRIAQLKKLQAAIEKFQAEIIEALKLDLNKSETESYLTEIALVKSEIALHIKRVKKWATVKSILPSLATFPSCAKVYTEPLGVVLIISPWNYPFQLTMAPLIAAISAGNCSIIKPSEFSMHTSNVLEKIIADTFDSNYISVVNGGKDVGEKLLELKFDHILFTGSSTVGKIVMGAAAKNLTPVTLELGGKSPAIVMDDANIKIAAKRIIWGKFLNSGQTCIAPDFTFVHRSVKEKFIEECINCIKTFFGNAPLDNEDYPKIISEKHFLRLKQLIDENRTSIIHGGVAVQEKYQIEPTLISLSFSKESFEKRIMQEEIFGPLMPIIEFENLSSVILKINSGGKPLALYLFTSSNACVREVISKTSSGGVCINDTIMHVANHNLPFGGIGASGMGAYHGRFGFETFSHKKSVLSNTTLFDIPLRYQPYKDKLSIIKMIMK